MSYPIGTTHRPTFIPFDETLNVAPNDAFPVPADARVILVTIRAASLTAAGQLVVQIGTGGALTTLGYQGASTRLVNAGAVATISPTTGFGVSMVAAASLFSGTFTLTKQRDSHIWSCAIVGHEPGAGTPVTWHGGGWINLLGNINLIGLTTDLPGSRTVDQGDWTMHVQ